MPDIPLQDYTAKTKEMIRNARLDEAIAHCQHILRHYPKHFETYCLLGEACLEKQMYREAIEFFQRTLGADPENLMARVGLGVIYDEQGAIPEAIWQLERAFELVPGNSEVRRELLRLYGRYDVIDKTRLTLTRGALGRLYCRNGLYDRAIGEFRAVLRQDPDLPDIRVALVEALWREGQQVAAVEGCLDLLDALPNCLKANLILGDIWLRGGNEESAEERLSVARELDPENRVAQEVMGADSPLPPEQVLVPELESIPETVGFVPARVPDAGETGVEEAVDTIADGVPDAEVQEPWGTDEELPDWLRDVGVTAEEEPALEEAAEEGDLVPSPDEALPTEEMPEWLQEVMGEEEPAPAGEPASVEDSVDQMLVVEDAAESLPSPEPPAAMAVGPLEEPEQELPASEMPDEAMPEWLEALLGEAESAAGGKAAPLAEQAADLEEETLTRVEEAPAVQEIPDWGHDLDTAEVEEITAPPVAEAEEAVSLEERGLPEDEIPDWLRSLGDVDAEEIAEAETEVIPTPPVVEVEEEDLVVAPMAEEETPSLEGQVLPEDEIPDWLRDLGVAEAEAEAPSAPPVTEMAETPVIAEEVSRIEEIPDWLRDLDTAEVEEIAAPPVTEEAQVQVPASLQALVAAGLLDEADLESAMAEMSEEEIAAQRAEDVPEWLNELIEGEPPEVAEAEVTPFEPLSQEPAAPVIEIPLEEALGEEAVPEADEPEPELAIEEAVLEAEEPEPEPAAEELVLEAEEPEPEPAIEESVLEAEEPGPEPTAEELVPEVEEPGPEPDLAVEEAVLEVQEPEPEPTVEESVPEVEEPGPEPTAEELVPEVEEPGLEPEPELAIEEAVLEVQEPEPEPTAEEPVPEVEEPGLPIEEAVLEAEEPEIDIPSRGDELLSQLKARPRDYGARLELARVRYAEKDWNAALSSYEKLISARRFLPEVIDDLESLLEQQVDPARVYHMLGDAYMQQDLLDEALEMYRLARQRLAKR